MIDSDKFDVRIFDSYLYLLSRERTLREWNHWASFCVRTLWAIHFINFTIYLNDSGGIWGYSLIWKAIFILYFRNSRCCSRSIVYYPHKIVSFTRFWSWKLSKCSFGVHYEICYYYFIFLTAKYDKIILPFHGWETYRKRNVSSFELSTYRKRYVFFMISVQLHQS